MIPRQLAALLMLTLGPLAGCAGDSQEASAPVVVTITATPSAAQEPSPSPGSEAPVAAAEPSSVNRSDEPESSTGADFGALPFAFSFKNGEGWTYRIIVERLPTVQAVSYLADSPPGQSRVRVSFQGPTAAWIQSEDEGRNAPEASFRVDYFWDSSRGLDPSDIPMTDAVEGPEHGRVFCAGSDNAGPACYGVATSVGGGETTPLVLQSSDSDEQLVDATVRTYSTERVTRLHLTGGLCGFWVDAQSGEVELDTWRGWEGCTIL